MSGVVVLLLFTWGLKGGIELNFLPQAITDSTSQIALSPYADLKLITPVRGLTIVGSWRGHFNDSTRVSRASSRLLNGYADYRCSKIPLHIRLGRHFSYLGLGGVVDGVWGKLNLRKWSLNFLGGKRAPSPFSEKDKFFDKNLPTLTAIQITTPGFGPLRLRTGFAMEKDGDETKRAPLWGSLTFRKGVSFRGEVYYDVEKKELWRLTFFGYGGFELLRWSIGYRFRNLQYAFELMGVTHEEEEEEEETEGALHRVELNLKLNKLPLALGGRVALGEDKSSPYLWGGIVTLPLRLKGWLRKEEDGWQKGAEARLTMPIYKNTFAFLSGRLIDEPRWPNVWVESARIGIWHQLKIGAKLTAELRIWSNPEVDREVQGYVSMYLPFHWRQSQ